MLFTKNLIFRHESYLFIQTAESDILQSNNAFLMSLVYKQEPSDKFLL